MSQVDLDSSQAFKLPDDVIGRSDVSHLLREIERLDNEITALNARERVGASVESTLALSDRLEDFLQLNELDLQDTQQRQQLIHRLRQFKDQAPVVHMTFASSADQESLGEIVRWVRQSIHPGVLVSVGLQPGIIGGVYLRTPNHVWDLSVRSQLARHRHLITEQVEALSGGF